MKLSVVIACHGDAPELPALVTCLRNQREYVTGEHSVTREPCYWVSGGRCQVEIEIVLGSDGPFLGDVSQIDRLVQREFAGNGHAAREAAMREATGDWIVLTNSDNVYCLGWAHSVAQREAAGVGMISWDCINNLWQWTGLGGCRLARGRIDLGCIAVRREVALHVGFPWRHYEGDWEYIDACRQFCEASRLKTIHIPQTLFVHN